jgi:hypothetical protein
MEARSTSDGLAQLDELVSTEADIGRRGPEDSEGAPFDVTK